MLDLAGWLVTARTLAVVAELGVPDLIAGHDRPVDEVAAAAGADPDALARLLRLLAARGLVAEPRPGRFRLAGAGRALRSDVPDSVAPWLRYLAQPDYWRMWAGLAGSARTGRTTYEDVEGTTFFAWLAGHPAEAAAFDAAMTATSDLANTAILATLDLAGVRSLVDVAGGHGSLLAALVRARPELTGVLVERPAVAALAGTGPLADPQVRGRVTVTAGDMFDHLPADHDAYLLKWVLHDWDGPDARRILATCRTAMRRGARLLVVEMLLDAGGAAVHTLDVSMLTLTGGRERSTAEYRRLLADSGFRLRRVTPTSSPFHVLDAVTS